MPKYWQDCQVPNLAAYNLGKYQYICTGCSKARVQKSFFNFQFYEGGNVFE
jgi:hypothetical protein